MHPSARTEVFRKGGTRDVRFQVYVTLRLLRQELSEAVRAEVQ